MFWLFHFFFVCVSDSFIGFLVCLFLLWCFFFCFCVVSFFSFFVFFHVDSVCSCYCFCFFLLMLFRSVLTLLPPLHFEQANKTENCEKAVTTRDYRMVIIQSSMNQWTIPLNSNPINISWGKSSKARFRPVDFGCPAAPTPSAPSGMASMNSSGGSSGMEISESVTTKVWEPELREAQDHLGTTARYG